MAAANYQDVMLAILAMDAYNEGYSPGMTLPNQTSIDGATITATDGAEVAKAASFRAVAYDWDGETVTRSMPRHSRVSTLRHRP